MADADDITHLLDFDRNRLGMFSEEQLQEQLRVRPSLMTNHLAIAKWIDGWVERMDHLDPSEHQDGFVAGVRDIAAHLRQGDFLPDGALLGDEF